MILLYLWIGIGALVAAAGCLIMKRHRLAVGAIVFGFILALSSTIFVGTVGDPPLPGSVVYEPGTAAP
jgi:hypothetical protein